jgi:SAM-dependent methyltransferase
MSAVVPGSRNVPAQASARIEILCAARPENADDVDDEGYLDANPDVRKAGMPGRAHYVQHGRTEGRLQWINRDKVAVAREQKLSRLRFRRQPVSARSFGSQINFISPEIKAEFAIPDSPPISANEYGGPFIDEVLNHPERLCLDVGAGLRSRYIGNFVNADVYPSISTDVVCVGEDMPFESAQFDYVICLAVLEHTRRPWEVASEICRVLKPGGKLLVDYPFLVGVHGFPHHYFNATPQGAISLFEGGCDIQSSTIGSNQHPLHALRWILAAWQQGLDADNRKIFESLSVKQLLGMPIEMQLRQSYCTDLSEEMTRCVAAGSTLVAVRKGGDPAPRATG